MLSLSSPFSSGLRPDDPRCSLFRWLCWLCSRGFYNVKNKNVRFSTPKSTSNSLPCTNPSQRGQLLNSRKDRPRDQRPVIDDATSIMLSKSQIKNNNRQQQQQRTTTHNMDSPSSDVNNNEQRSQCSSSMESLAQLLRRTINMGAPLVRGFGFATFLLLFLLC